mgnify:CR=1 FL=1
MFKSGNKEVLLKEIYKSPTEFGGGKGSGGGAADTAINESLQCFYASILFNTPGVETLTVKKGKIRRHAIPQVYHGYARSKRQ